MSASTTQTHLSALPQATFTAMLRSTMDSLLHHPRATQDEIATRREAAYLVIEALRPRDPLESMLATRVVATHYHAMHNLGCATQRDLPTDLQLRLQGRAVALSVLMDATLHTLMDRQTAAPRRVAALPAPVAAPRPQVAPVVARAGEAAVPTPDVAAAPAPAAPAQATPTQAAPARAAQAAAATAKVPPATPAPKPAQGSTFAAHAAMEERLRAEAAARMGTSVDALLGLAA